MQVPRGDVLHQFREDVRAGKLPAVSWLIAPEKFSDHPTSPWFGAWYLSETLDILTRNPEVWRKTIFILCYDENDGPGWATRRRLFPSAGRPETGRASAGLDTSLEHVEEDATKDPASRRRRLKQDGPIGLGYRVP